MSRWIVGTVGILAWTLCSGVAGAQIYPVKGDLQKGMLKGPVMEVQETARSWSPELKRWNPLVQRTVSSYTPEGRLRRRIVALQNRPVDRSLFVYDSISGKPAPVAEASAGGTEITADAEPIQEQIFTYDEKGRLKFIIERDFRQKLTTITQHVLDTKGRVKLKVTSDSASGYVRKIEEFFWGGDDRPTGSTIRHFDPKTDPFRSLADTARVPASHVGRDYTSYGYEDTLHPVLWLSWELGRDTVVDRQELRKFDEENNLYSSLMQRYESGKTVQTQARIYNPFGDILSAADSFGEERTYERAFDYIYDERDEHGNWLTKRQYIATDPESGDQSPRVLLSRVDRVITYY